MIDTPVSIPRTSNPTVGSYRKPQAIRQLPIGSCRKLSDSLGQDSDRKLSDVGSDGFRQSEIVGKCRIRRDPTRSYRNSIGKPNINSGTTNPVYLHKDCKISILNSSKSNQIFGWIWRSLISKFYNLCGDKQDSLHAT
jgi:hypothetical protein